MGIFKDILLNFNIFQTQQFFRFNGDHEYTNVTGGIFTLLIRGLLLALLIFKLISVFTYSTVISSSTTKYQIQEVNGTVLAPSNTTSPFLLAIEAYQITQRLDRATLIKDTVAWAYNSSRAYTYLQLCTSDHWAAVPADVYQQLLSSTAAGSLLFCLPKNYSHNISIAQDKSIEIDFAYRCRLNCSQVPYTKFLVRPIIYNRLINLQNSEDYLTNYLDKRRYYSIDTINRDVDIVLNYQLVKYSITTDKSVLPYESNIEQRGLQIPNQPTLAYLPNRYPTNLFFRMNYILGNQEYYHFRSFTKILDAISLVGGLIPVFTLLFIWLNYYAIAQFEMTFVKRMHSDQKAREYGVFYFISKIFYSILRLMNIDMTEWKETQQYHQMHKKVAHLIDILYLYKRLEFLERAIEMILEDHQLKVLHLMRHKTFQEAEKDYQAYQMKVNLQKFIERRKRILRSDSSKSSDQHPRQILLEPIKGSNEGDPVSHKNLFVRNQLDDHPPNMIQRKNEDVAHVEEENSENNEEVEKAQMDALREAYRCYQKIKREAEDSQQDYFSWISNNIFNSIDDVDRVDLQNLNNLLRAEDRKELQDLVMKELKSSKLMKSSKQISFEDSLYHKNSQNNLINSSKEFKSGSLHFNNGSLYKLEKLPEKKDDEEDDL